MRNYIDFKLIEKEFVRIMHEEAKLNPACKNFTHSSKRIYDWAVIVGEYARSESVMRGWCPRYGLTENQEYTTESVGGHSFLVNNIVEWVLENTRLEKSGMPIEEAIRGKEGYLAKEVLLAAKFHDLAENTTGDIIDNGVRDEAKKRQLEREYFEKLTRYVSPKYSYNVLKILLQMEDVDNPNNIAARLLYAADKVSVVITALTYDMKVRETFGTDAAKEIASPTMRRDYPFASPRDKAEMELADDQESPTVKGSEMWTIDILKLRKILERCDDTGAITALLVMYTLMVNGKWYLWREADYKAA